MTKLLAFLAVFAFASPSFAASATATASSSSSTTGGVTISGSCSGSCTVHSSATVTRNGVTVSRERTQVGTGSFSEHTN